MCEIDDILATQQPIMLGSAAERRLADDSPLPLSIDKLANADTPRTRRLIQRGQRLRRTQLAAMGAVLILIIAAELGDDDLLRVLLPITLALLAIGIGLYAPRARIGGQLQCEARGTFPPVTLYGVETVRQRHATPLSNPAAPWFERIVLCRYDPVAADGGTYAFATTELHEIAIDAGERYSVERRPIIARWLHAAQAANIETWDLFHRRHPADPGSADAPQLIEGQRSPEHAPPDG